MSCTKATSIDFLKKCEAHTHCSWDGSKLVLVESRFHPLKLDFKPKILRPNIKLLVIERPNLAMADSWVDPILQLGYGDFSGQTEKIDKREAGTWAMTAKGIQRMQKEYAKREMMAKFLAPSPKIIREKKFKVPKFSSLGPGISHGQNVRSPTLLSTRPRIIGIEKPNFFQSLAVIEMEKQDIDLRIKLTENQLRRLRDAQSNE